MSTALGHFLVGATCTALCLAVLNRDCSYRGTIVVLGGMWGLAPDVHHIAPLWQHELRTFHRHAPFLDVFWFHRTLDVYEQALGRRFLGLALFAMLGSVALLEWRAQ